MKAIGWLCFFFEGSNLNKQSRRCICIYIYTSELYQSISLLISILIVSSIIFFKIWSFQCCLWPSAGYLYRSFAHGGFTVNQDEILRPLWSLDVVEECLYAWIYIVLILYGHWWAVNLSESVGPFFFSDGYIYVYIYMVYVHSDFGMRGANKKARLIWFPFGSPSNQWILWRNKPTTATRLGVKKCWQPQLGLKNWDPTLYPDWLVGCFFSANHHQTINIYFIPVGFAFRSLEWLDIGHWILDKQPGKNGGDSANKYNPSPLVSSLTSEPWHDLWVLVVGRIPIVGGLNSNFW